MRELAGEIVTDEFLRTLWASRLPQLTRAVIKDAREPDPTAPRAGGNRRQDSVPVPPTHVRTGGGETVSDEFLRALWSSRLPQLTRAIVNSQLDLQLDRLAQIAGQIHEDSCRRLQVTAVETNQLAEILTREFKSLEVKLDRRGCSRHGSPEAGANR